MEIQFSHIKLVKIRGIYIGLAWALNPGTTYFIGGEGRRHTEIHRKESHADSGKDWSGMDTTKECQQLLGAKTRQEEVRKDFSVEPS